MEQIITSIQASEDKQELLKIQAACTARIKELEDRAYAEAKEAAWNRVKNYRPGATLYFAFTGHIISGQIKYGRSMTVRGIQPRAKRLWVTLADGTQTYFDAQEVYRYGIQPSQPKPRDKGSEAFGKVLDRVFG